MKRSKFNVNTSKKAKEKRTIDGYTFSSDLECKYYEHLLELQKQGEVTKIEIQPRFLLQEEYKKYGKKIRKIEYVADFYVYYKDGHSEIVDTKGFTTPDFKLKQKMFDYKYPDLMLRTISFSKIDGGFVDLDIITKNRKERKKAKLLKLK